MIIGILSPKGGQGKSVVARNLAHALSLQEFRVLLVDADPQGNLSSFAYPYKPTHTLTHCLQDVSFFSRAAIEIEKGTSLLCADIALADFIAGTKRKLASRFTDLLSSLYYDHIIIDTPPSINALSKAARAASSLIVVPVQMQRWAIEGIDALCASLGVSQQEIIVQPNFVQPHTRLAKQGLLWLKDKHKYVNDYIKQSVQIEEATARAQTVFSYAPKHQACGAFNSLATLITEVSK